jgi:hypothetical protein
VGTDNGHTGGDKGKDTMTGPAQNHVVNGQGMMPTVAGPVSFALLVPSAFPQKLRRSPGHVGSWGDASQTLMRSGRCPPPHIEFWGLVSGNAFEQA